MMQWQNGFLGVSKAAALGWARGPDRTVDRGETADGHGWVRMVRAKVDGELSWSAELREAAESTD